MAASPSPHPVTLYAVPGCLLCRRTRAFLQQRGVPFREVNVLANPRSLLKVLTTYRMVFPVVVVGSEAIQGCNEHRLAEVLARHSN